MTRGQHQRRLWGRRPNGNQAKPAPALKPSSRFRPLTPMVAETCLSELALVLEGSGWMTLPQFEVSPQFLRVIDARVPRLGESVMLVPAPNIPSVEQVPWFKSSMGVLFGPCTAPVKAAEAIHFLLSPRVAIALRGRRDPPGPYR